MLHLNNKIRSIFPAKFTRRKKDKVDAKNVEKPDSFAAQHAVWPDSGKNGAKFRIPAALPKVPSEALGLSEMASAPQAQLYKGLKVNLGRFLLKNGRPVPEPAPGTGLSESIRVSRICDTSGAIDWLVSSTIAMGATGKFRLMLKLDPRISPELLTVAAVKEFRTDMWPTRDRFDAQNNLIPYKTKQIWVEEFSAEWAQGEALNSPVRLRDTVSVNGKLFASMDEMDGGDVINLVNTVLLNPRKYSGEARLGIALRFLESVGQQLTAFYHIDRTIHGDVKPDNVFWNSGGEFVVGDLGGSFRANRQGFAVGGAYTWAYTSPERRADLHGPYTRAADVWATGVSVLDFWGNEPSPQTYDIITGEAKRRVPNVFADRKVNRLDLLEKNRTAVLDIRTDALPEEQLQKMADQGNPFAKVFLRVSADSPELSDYLLHKLGGPPETRESAQDLVAFAQSQLTPRLRAKAFAAMQQAAKSNYKREAIVQVLRKQAAQLMAASAPTERVIPSLSGNFF
jgi:serine/threonine protein kinase